MLYDVVEVKVIKDYILYLRFEDGTKLNNTLLYFSDMEIGHLKILQIEKESMERFEEGDVYWPMVHVGP